MTLRSPLLSGPPILRIFTPRRSRACAARGASLGASTLSAIDMDDAPSLDDRAKAADLLARWTRSFADIPRASGKEVVTLRDSGRKVVLIDVRSSAEMEVSVLPGAIGADEFERRCRSSPEEYHGAICIPYCTIGFRSGLYCRRLLAGEFGLPAPDVRNGEGVVLWSFDVGTFEGGARALHVYGSEWDVAAAGFKTVRFGARGHLAGALRMIVSLLRLVRSRLSRFVPVGR